MNVRLQFWWGKKRPSFLRAGVESGSRNSIFMRQQRFWRSGWWAARRWNWRRSRVRRSRRGGDSMWVCRNINSFERDESEPFQEAHLGVPSKQSKAISVSALSLESLSHRLVSFVPSLVFIKLRKSCYVHWPTVRWFRWGLTTSNLTFQNRKKPAQDAHFQPRTTPFKLLAFALRDIYSSRSPTSP